MAAFNGQRNTRLSNAFNTDLRVNNYQVGNFEYPAQLNPINNIFIYDVLNTPVPIEYDYEGQHNAILHNNFNTNLRVDSENTYVDFLQTTYKGQFNTVLHDFFIDLPQVDNYIPAPIISEGGRLNTIFDNALLDNIYIIPTYNMPYIKKYGQFFPKVTGGYRYGGNTTY